MRIVLINHYAGSPRHGMEFRPFYMARAWAREGHDVTIVAASQSHLRKPNPEVSRWSLTEQIEGVRYRWLWSPRYSGMVQRTFNILWFVLACLLAAPMWAWRDRPNVVIASSTYPLDIFPAWLLARLSGARLVFEVHDLWPLTPIELGGISRWHPFMMLLQAAECFAYVRSDRVVSLLPAAREHMVAHGMAPEKMAYIPNGIDVAEASDAAPLPASHTDQLERLRSEGRFIVGYAGGHSLSNSLDTLLDAAALLRDEPVAFALVGQGPDKETLMARARDMGLEQVHFLEVVGKRQVPSFVAQADALYLGWKRSPLYRFGVNPNKLIDYMLSGRPVLHGIEAANDLVAETGCGLSFAPESPQALADGVRRMMATHPDERKAMGERGRQHVLQHLDYPLLAERCLRAMCGLD